MILAFNDKFFINKQSVYTRLNIIFLSYIIKAVTLMTGLPLVSAL